MKLTIELEREVDGRWLAEISELPGVMAYGSTQGEAAQLACALAFSVLADRIDSGELDVTTAQRALVRRRLAAHKANPDAARPWSEARREIESLLKHEPGH